MAGITPAQSLLPEFLALPCRKLLKSGWKLRTHRNWPPHTPSLTGCQRDGRTNWVFSTMDRARKRRGRGKTAQLGQGPLRPWLDPLYPGHAQGCQVSASAAGADGARWRPPGAGAPNLLPPERESPPEPLPISVLIRRKDPPPPPATRVHTSPVASRGSG